MQFLAEKLLAQITVTATYKLLPHLPKESIAIGDKGYISGELEKFLKGLKIELSPIFKKSMKNKCDYLAKRKIKKVLKLHSL